MRRDYEKSRKNTTWRKAGRAVAKEARAWKKPLRGVKREGKAFAKGFLSAGVFMLTGPRRRRRR